MSKLPTLARSRWLKEPALQRVLALVAEAGGEARVAGGAVRNALLGEPVGDIDIATNLPPQAITEAFQAAGLSVHPTGIEHGTVTVVVDHHPYEITTLRHDIKTDGRRAVVSFTDDWQADALRRDFTINSLYCDARGTVFDYTGGHRDILRKRLVFVGNPRLRITEDNLRILRFFRFLAAYEKMSADRASLAACVRLKKGLLGLSAERIAREMFKLLAGPNAVPVLKLMAKHKVLKNILAHTEEFRVIGRLPADPLLRAFALAKKPETLQETWRLSNSQAKRIEALLHTATLAPSLREFEQKRILYALGAGTWRDAASLAWARSRASLTDRSWRRLLNLPSRWEVPRFPVTGQDLIEIGFPPGPDLGRELQRLEELWIVADFKPTKDALLQSIKET
jgi:tRNA nucleotidyltransferase/poly(A) polymerase